MTALTAGTDPGRQAIPTRPLGRSPWAIDEGGAISKPGGDSPQFTPRKRTLSDNLGLLADAFRGSRSNTEALQQRDMQDQQLWLAQQRPEMEFQQQKRLIDYRNQFEKPDKTALQQNYEYLKGINPQLAESFLQSEANKPQWVTADNGDGTKTVVPIYPGMASPQPSPIAPGAGGLPEGYTVRKKGGSTRSGSGTFQPSAVMGALIQQESGGRAGVTGPQTPYGRAQGLAQLLPGTAQEMAQKLGVPWRPDLMTGTSRQAADYQRSLGEAYFNEGLSKTGNMRDALRYYHGGPNRRMWGRKTNSYADSVLSRAGRM